jgi:hypothetical protein
VGLITQEKKVQFVKIEKKNQKFPKFFIDKKMENSKNID